MRAFETEKTEVAEIDRSVYDIKDKVNAAFEVNSGLTTEIVEQISKEKHDPEWMREFRLKALDIYNKASLPNWGPSLEGLDMRNIVTYVRPNTEMRGKWSEVPDDIKNTFERLGIPKAERASLAGVGAQYDSEVVYHNVKSEVAEQGVVYTDMESALTGPYAEMVRTHFMKLVPPTDHKFAALHGAVWSGGSFVYVPAGVHVEIPLQSYFRLNAKGAGQFEHTLIIVDIPVKVTDAAEGVYTTIPLGILLTQQLIVTVCSADTPVIADFAACRVKGFSTRKKMRFVYQLLYRAATMYQQELRLIDRRRIAIEKNLSGDLRDSDLMELHGLESTLVYFATSLRANATVLDRLTRYKRLEQYPDDRDLLDDVIVEIRQAIEMTGIYRDDIKGTRELFSSILDNRMNTAMKYLTSITLLMAVPTVISGLYGMNVQSDGMPFANTTAGFAIVLGLTLALCVFAAWVLHKKHML